MRDAKWLKHGHGERCQEGPVVKASPVIRLTPMGLVPGAGQEAAGISVVVKRPGGGEGRAGGLSQTPMCA